MLTSITQQGDFKLYLFDQKCSTSLDIGGGITDCLQGEFIISYQDREIFRCNYHYETYDIKHTFKLYNVNNYDIPYIKSILRHMPKEHRIIKAILAYKKK